jgi:fibronectin type 3 domain-containing protein
MHRRRVGRVVLAVMLGVLGMAAAAFAAPRLSGHRYTSRRSAGSAGSLVFRVSSNGRTMRLSGRVAFAMRCYRNGKVVGRVNAVVADHADTGSAGIIPAPLVKISSNGTFYGAAHRSLRLGAAPHETVKYHFAGRFILSGEGVVGRFFANNCSSQQFYAALVNARATKASPRATASGLVAAYAFDEGSGSTVTDASGNGNNGTLTNATWATTGKYGKALSFNGTTALVTIPNSASLQLSSGMTLEAWVNPSTVNGNWRDVIYKANDNFYLEATSTNSSRPDGGLIAGGSYADAFGTAALAANTWSFLTETYDGTTLRLYVNGTQVASTAHTGAITTSTNPLQIGGDSLYGQHFAGMIDNVRIYNTALTAAQIQTDQATAISTAPDATPPSQPGTLTATAASGTEIDLSWGASTDNVGVTGYDVERCSGSGCTNFTQIAITGTGTTYKDTTVAANSTYVYRVRAFDAAGNLSPYSNTSSATTPAPDTTPPSQPGTLSAPVVTSSEVDLSWGASTDNVGVTAYLIERCTGPGCGKPVNGQPSPNFQQIASVGGSTTTYKDTTVSANTDYSYQVRSTDAAGNLSPYSNVTSIQTLAAPSGLVAAYAFDEGSGSTVTDASGNGNNGTLTNATWATTGKYGKALSFNGTTALVTIPNSASLQLSSGMTLEAWVNPSTVDGNWRDVIYKANDNYYLEGTSTNGARPDAGLIAGSSYADAFGTSSLPANTWSFLAETYDGSTLRLYVNGTQVAVTAHSGSIATSTNALQIGGDSVYGQYFAGMIDEVRVYNTALSASQVLTDESTPINAPSAPTSLTANPVSAGEIDLTWGASTDSHGVTGYQVERCQGSSCTNFTQIATPTATSYNDTSVAANTVYRYRVRAVDSLGTAGAYSNIVTTTTGLGVAPDIAVVAVGSTEQFTAQGPASGGATWSVDGVAGGNSTVGTITSSGLYSPPSGVGQHTVMATSGTQTANATVYVSNDPGMLTFHNDNMRTGQNPNETVLTPSNVNPTTFGKVASYPLDGLTLASPLYVQHVNIPGQGIHNIVIVATEHDSVYAFDADGKSSLPLWHANFTNPTAGVTTVPAADTGETFDIPNEIGITGTPVIDPSTGTIYVVAKTKEVSGGNTNYVQRLHALDLTTGAEKPGSPVVIQASVPGTGDGSSNGTLPFDPLHENQRAALALINGVVYIGFSSHGDHPPFHGWVLGYNASTLTRVMVYCATPNTSNGGVWMDGDGVATDSSGSLYFITGDGDFNANTGGTEYGDSFLRLSTNGTVQDYFTPSVQTTLDQNNLDLGSGGVLLLPDQPGAHPHEMLSAGKNGTVYLVDRDSMGHYNASSDPDIQSLTNIFPNTQGIEGGNFSSPVYWNGNVYFAPVGGAAQAFKLTNGLLSTSPTSKSSETYAGRGGTMAISANGTSSGILWTLQTGGPNVPGILHAYDATNLSNELYNSNQAGSRDALDEWDKFSVPLVANGQVFIAGTSQLTVFGLLQ